MRPNDIAIIGIGCRYPGGADSPAKFWDMIMRGVDAIGDVPRERWDIDAFYDPRAGIPGKTVSRRGGFIEGIDQFDAEFFGISPREAELMDPQQRLLLEAAWEALEDGGVVLEREAAGTGVFVGISTNDYSLLQSGLDELRVIDVYTTTGSVMSIAANRVSYALDLGGPSLAVDTACSSSLIAMHLACRSLRSGDCKLALVGGVNALLLPTPFVAFSRMSMLAADGRCKAFDASADGFVRSEGVGVLALQPLADALAEGRPVYAVIRGTAANQDGHTNGLTVPSAAAQESVIRAACRDAGVEESAISYVEAHGTGTPVGDPIEAHALGKAIGEARPADRPLMIGSVKTNIGHLEAGAGVAGVIKAALTLKHGKVPPSLNFEKPTPYVPFNDLNLRVVTAPEALPAMPALAGVNSFGFGGSNAHAILQSPPQREAAEGVRDVGAVLLTLSPRTRERRAGVAGAWKQFLEGEGAALDLADIAHSAATRRNHRGERVAIAAADRGELIARLRMLADGETPPGTTMGRPDEETPRPVFVYSGQGTQWWAMGRELFATDPTFRSVIERCDALFCGLGDWSLIEELQRDEESSRMDMTAIAQPAIFAIQAALTTLWRSWGIEPAATVGHSVGEVAAAWAAGILSFEDAARVIYHRGRTMEGAKAKGRMLAAAIGVEEARALIAPHGERVSLGAVNSPALMTLSGDGEPLEEIAAGLKSRGVFHRFLAVQYAFHSAHMDGIRDDLLDALGVVPLQQAAVPAFSTVSAARAGDGDFGTEYWWRNVREPVMFGPAIEQLVADGYRTFVEVGAHPALSGPIAEVLRAAGERGSVHHSLKRGEAERVSMLTALGGLYVAGHAVNWDEVFGGRRDAVRLPREAWQRQRFWHESDKLRAIRQAPAAHPLLARSLEASEPTWETDLDLKQLSWLVDHRVNAHAVFPAAGYVEMMLGASRLVLGSEGAILEDIDFRKALVVSEEEPPTKIQLRYRASDGLAEVVSRDRAGDWAMNAVGSLRKPEVLKEPPQVDIAALRANLPETMSGESLAETFAENGLRYGPAFLGIEEAYRRDGESLGRVTAPEALAGGTERYRAHPAILDACLQVIISALPNEAPLAPGPFLPVHIDRLDFRAPLGDAVWCHVAIRLAAGRTIVADLKLLDDSGRALIELEGFRCQALARQRSAASASMDEWLHAEAWRARPRAGSASAADSLAPMARIAAAAQAIADRHAAPDGLVGLHIHRGAVGDELATAWVVNGLRELGWAMRTGHRTSVKKLRERLGVIPTYHRLFDRYLWFLEEDGIIARDGDTITVVKRPPARDPNTMWRKLVHEEPGLLPELTLVRRSGTRLAAVLQGKVDPLQVLFPDGSSATLEHLYQSGWSAITYDQMTAEAIAEAISTVPAGRPVRVLEIGAGTGGLTAHVLPRLPADHTQYLYTDLSNAFFSRAEQAFFDYRFVEYATLNIEKTPQEQGYEPGSFDIILASDVLHATRDLRETFANIRALLAPGGLFAAIEIPPTSRWPDLVFGVTDGWWRFDDGIRTTHAAISGDAWERLMTSCDFDDARALTLPGLAESDRQVVLLCRRPLAAGSQTAAPVAAEPVFDRPWLLLADAGGLADGMAAQLSARGDRPIIVRPGDMYQRDGAAFTVRPDSRDDFGQLIGDLDADGLSPAVVVHLWGLDAPDADATTPASLLEAETRGTLGLLHVTQAISAAGRPATRLVIATRGSQEVLGNPITLAAAPVWGFGRVIANEERGLECVLVDLDPAVAEDEPAELIAEVALDDGEREIAFRGGGRHVNRIVRTSFERLVRPSADKSEVGYRLEIPTPGVLDRLALVERKRRAPGPGEVEIEVRAASLNFRDVMKALGIYPSESADDDLPGDECSGVVVAVGAGVKGLSVGDAVVAMGSGCLASHVTLATGLVFRKPDRLDFDEAVTIPVPFLTAWHALHEVGRIRRGETVLIHAATGGVGLAAIQVAQAAGATVFATAGSDEKRELLRALGVARVMDSRSLAFADEIHEVTGGRGVDIVLNSLAGRAIEKGLASLAPGGRFLEIGKSDIYQNARVGLRPFRNNVSLQAIDLRQIMDTRPDLVASAIRQVLKRVEAGRFHALPHRIYPMDRVVDAFRHLAQARHIGKVIVTTAEARVTPVPVANKSQPELRADATYVITGGLGGFGLALAEWLADRGALHLVLIGRRGAATPEAAEGIERLAARGVEAVAEAADMTSRADVDRVFDRIERDMPPVRGIVHAAMVLDDGVVSQLDAARFRRVTAPKVLGGWHVHQRSLGLKLDFFVLFSSVSAMIGNAGQANYVAANSFLIALAQHRHRLGLPALAVDWGRIADAGYVDRNSEVAQRLERMGLLGMPVAKATEALGRLITSDANHVGLVRVDWQIFNKLGDGRVPIRLSELADASASSGEQGRQGLGQILLAAPEAERLDLLVSMLRDQVANVLRASAADLDVERPLTDLGLDSLMAIDLVNRIESEFEVAMPRDKLTVGATISGLAATLLELITGAAAAPTAKAAGEPAASNAAPKQCAVPLRSGGSRPPLFLIHPSGGEVAIYGPLAAALPPSLPVIGIRSRALVTKLDEFETFDEMTAAYADLIRQQQPEGPLYLGGFSFGGYVALAAAAAFEKSGREVALVALVDTDPTPTNRASPRTERLRAFAQDLATVLGRGFGLFEDVDDAELEAQASGLLDELLAGPAADRAARTTAWLAERGLDQGPSADQLRRSIPLLIRHIEMIDGYKPTVVRAPIASWRARAKVDPAVSWSGIAGGGFEEELLDCGHFEILAPPAATRIAASLDAAIFDADKAAVRDEAAE